jgi:hypothetical protein
MINKALWIRQKVFTLNRPTLYFSVTTVCQYCTTSFLKTETQWILRYSLHPGIHGAKKLIKKSRHSKFDGCRCWWGTRVRASRAGALVTQVDVAAPAHAAYCFALLVALLVASHQIVAARRICACNRNRRFYESIQHKASKIHKYVCLAVVVNGEVAYRRARGVPISTWTRPRMWSLRTWRLFASCWLRWEACEVDEARVWVPFAWQDMCLYMAANTDLLNGRNPACNLQIRSALMIIWYDQFLQRGGRITRIIWQVLLWKILLHMPTKKVYFQPWIHSDSAKWILNSKSLSFIP